MLRDAFGKVEKRQLSKTTSYLETLNSTVLAELREFRQQYDQIWQSTVIELESQRDQSQREMLAVSTRLNLLADEVVFQKRMSIVQSVLLLLCLGLVIFSRGFAGGNVDLPIVQSMMARSRTAKGLAIDSPTGNVAFTRARSSPEVRQWESAENRRHRSDESTDSTQVLRSDDSPATPLSTYSGTDEDGNRVAEPEDPLKGVRTSLTGEARNDPDAFHSPAGINTSPLSWQGGDSIPAEAFRPSSPSRIPKRRASFSRIPQPSLNPDIGHPDTQFYRQGLEDEEGDEEHVNNDLGDGRDLTWGREEERQQRNGTMDGSPPLPSPPPEREKLGFSIARKPLPALPRDHS